MATNMDLADKVELDQVITFPSTQSTWNIVERLSPYPTPSRSNCMPVSDSFAHSYVFRVELAASGEKVVSDHIPKFAIVKMKCRYSLDSASKPTDAIDTDLLAEIRALEQLTMNKCAHSPRILDAKVELHLTSMRNFDPLEGTQEERHHYVTYILMTEAKGICLRDDVFWTFSEEERKMIRLAFRTALSNIYTNWITFRTPNPKHLVWNHHTATITYVNFESSLTFKNLGANSDPIEQHISRTLPTRYQSWSNSSYTDWGLSRDAITPFCKGTDGTVFADAEQRVRRWSEEYAREVVREPRMPTTSVSTRLVGKGIEENKERSEYMLHLEVFRDMNRRSCVVM